jgi:hypothetical protein
MDISDNKRLSVAFILAILSDDVGSAMPMPFPLPANFTFGVCGIDPSVLPNNNCTTAVRLASKVSVRCSSQAGCNPNCQSSALFQGVFARYEARLGSGTAASLASTAREKPQAGPKPVGSGTQSYWWRLNNTDCPGQYLSASCSGLNISQCEAKCVSIPNCGGFLYSKTGQMNLRNQSCWADIDPLPASDNNDDLFVLRSVPQPPPLPAHGGVLSAVDVCVADSSEDLGPTTDESYSLAVPVPLPAAASTEIVPVIKAQTIFGAMHGLETLTQLVDIRVGPGGDLTIPSAPIEIRDRPRFPFRGLLIDSGRHFLPLAHIKHVIQAASMVKLNVLHWHLSDVQSFPVCSEVFPLLCEHGALPNQHSAHADLTGSPSKCSVPKANYSLAELRDVVQFAKAHGVRVVPEWDVPGHGSWSMGMPELATSACHEVLDVTRPELYSFLAKFFVEMESVFTDKYLFLGGDEVNPGCFDNSPAVATWMKQRGLNASQTQQYFWKQMTAQVFPQLHRIPSVWRGDSRDMGPHPENLPRGSVLNVYQSLATAWRSTIPVEKAPTVVSMANENWYLDSECGLGYNQDAWKCVYAFKGPLGSWLMDPKWSKDQQELFLGGETAIWVRGQNPV